MSSGISEEEMFRYSACFKRMDFRLNIEASISLRARDLVKLSLNATLGS